MGTEVKTREDQVGDARRRGRWLGTVADEEEDSACAARPLSGWNQVPSLSLPHLELPLFPYCRGRVGGAGGEPILPRFARRLPALDGTWRRHSPHPHPTSCRWWGTPSQSHPLAL